MTESESNFYHILRVRGGNAVGLSHAYIFVKEILKVGLETTRTPCRDFKMHFYGVNLENNIMTLRQLSENLKNAFRFSKIAI